MALRFPYVTGATYSSAFPLRPSHWILFSALHLFFAPYKWTSEKPCTCLLNVINFYISTKSTNVSLKIWKHLGKQLNRHNFILYKYITYKIIMPSIQIKKIRIHILILHINTEILIPLFYANLLDIFFFSIITTIVLVIFVVKFSVPVYFSKFHDK